MLVHKLGFQLFPHSPLAAIAADSPPPNGFQFSAIPHEKQPLEYLVSSSIEKLKGFRDLPRSIQEVGLIDSNFSLPFSLAPHNRPPLQLGFQKFWPIILSLTHSHKVWPLPKIHPTNFFFLS